MSDTDDDAFGREERRRRRRLGFTIAALVLVPVGYVAQSDARLWLTRRAARLTVEQRSELRSLLDAREAAARQRVDLWNTASRREALEALTPSEAPCPEAPVAPTPVAAGTYVKFSTHDPAFGNWSLCILRPDADAAACAVKYVAPAEQETLRARLQDGDIYTWDLEAAKTAPPVEEPPRVVVAVDSEVRGKLRDSMVGHLSYVQGSLSGRAALFIPSEGRMVCAGPVTAQNSKNIDAEFDTLGSKPTVQQAEEEGVAALERDLEVRLRLALPPVWRKLAPH